MASTTKPTVLIVHGAWHQPAHFESFRAPGTPKFPMIEDAAVVSAELDRLIGTEGRSVLLLTHSYGGCVAVEAARDALSQTARAKQGLAGGIVGLVFVCSAVPSPAVPAMNPQAQWPAYMLLTDDGGCAMDDPAEVFYNDVADDEVRRGAIALLAPTHPRNTFTDPVSHFGYAGMPCAYVFCEKDVCIPLYYQQMFVAASGVDMRTVSLDSGHSPFYSMPEKLVEVVEDMAR